MRLLSALLLVPAVVLAQSQEPFKDQATKWFQKAKAYLPYSPPPSLINAASSRFAGTIIESITNENWREKVLHRVDDANAGPEEWMIMFSGNVSCLGTCQAADVAFNESAILLALETSAPRLGIADCDEEKLLCATWATSLPAIWHFQISGPAAERANAPSPLHIIPLHPQNVTMQDILKIHTAETYREQPEYTGAYHPIDGWLQQYGLFEPLGYVMWGFGAVPSWAFMIVVSLLSRQMMPKRGAPGTAAGRPSDPAVGNRR